MLPSDPPPLSRAALRRPRILLVDDDPSVLRALWRMLKNCRPDFKINGAANAAEALEALSELHYDAVITDLQMPGGGGQAVLGALVEHHPETARIVHSSQLESPDTAELRAMAHAVLAKPASESELVHSLESAFLKAGSRSTPASADR
jgi:DNA-binding NarL/FixJ family response regulator